MISLRTLAIVGVLLAAYLYYPPPTPSPRLQQWVKSGTYFNYEGHKIFYKDDRSKENGPVLVCLHGFPTMSYDWMKVWPALLGKFSRVIALDFIGHGFSDKPTDIPYTVKLQADIVENLLSELKIKRAHILAHDYGDSVAQELLARYNERDEVVNHVELLSVCLTNGGIFHGIYYPRLSQRVMLSPVGDIAARLINYYTFKRGMSEVFGPETQPDAEEFTDFYAGVTYNQGNLVLPAVLDYINQRRDNKDRWVGALQEADIPVHVIYGNADPVNPPPFIEHWKKTVSVDSITVLRDGVGHYPAWEDPAGTMKAYFYFIHNLPYN